MHFPKYETILLIADRQRRTTSKLKNCYYWSVTRTFHLYIKKDLYFAPKIKWSNIFLGDPVIGTFKKLSYERKLGWYFSLLTSLVDKYFQIRVSNKVNWRCHLKGVFSQRLHAKCLQSVWMIHKYWNSYKNVL